MPKISLAASRPKISLAASRAAAVAAIGVIATGATAAAFVQSYRGLYDWALHQAGIPPSFAWFWPLLVDSFLALGELRLYVAAVDGAGLRDRAQAWAWLLTLSGLTASVAGNVGSHGWTAGLPVQLSAAVAPLAAAAGLGTALGLVKSAARKTARKTAPAPAGTMNGEVHRPVPGDPWERDLAAVRAIVAEDPDVKTEHVRKRIGTRFDRARDLLAAARQEVAG
jgi:hypothetical protein